MDITAQRIIIAVMSICFLSIVLLVIRLALKQKRMRGKALEKLSSPNGTGTLDSVEYRYRYYPGSKNSPSSFRVEIDAPSGSSFKVTREGGFDRLSKQKNDYWKGTLFTIVAKRLQLYWNNQTR